MPDYFQPHYTTLLVFRTFEEPLDEPFTEHLQGAKNERRESQRPHYVQRRDVSGVKKGVETSRSFIFVSAVVRLDVPTGHVLGII